MFIKSISCNNRPLSLYHVYLNNYRGVGIMVLGIMMLFWNYDAILELWCCYFFKKF